MQFEVTIDFRSGPSFSTVVGARDEAAAKAAAVNWARANGFNAATKKYTVMPA
jgi:hypothetical protein